MNYAGRKFRPVSNTPKGEVNGQTLFHYEQHGDLFTASYAGGGIRLHERWRWTVGDSGEGESVVDEVIPT